MAQLILEKIRLDGGTQPRAEIDPFIVGDYAEAIQNGAQFPPIIAFFDGSEYWLADGFHRVNACKKAGITEVVADVRQGTRRDAVLFSVGANATHGLRRTNQDKRRAVETLLRDTEWANWSNNQIAKQCAVSLDLVNRMRKDTSLNETLSERTYTTKHGTTAVMDTAKIGTTKRQLVYDKAPEPVKTQLQDGVIGVNEAYEVTRALEQAPEPVKAKVIETLQAGEMITAREIAVLSDKPEKAGAPKALQMSVSNEWYTPSVYIEAARQLMGGIDTDPASNPIANRVVRAATYYTVETNGMDKDWRGRVWLNPPYGRDNGESNQDVWSARLIEQYRAGITVEAVLLVNAVTDRKWFQPLWDFPICFTDHRIKFYDENGEAGQPTHGNCFVYFGKQTTRFTDIFSQFGVVVGRLTAATVTLSVAA